MSAASPDFDRSFMNHSYVSELWLQGYLTEIREKHPDWWSDEYEKQLDDERRHSRACLKVLEQDGAVVSHSTSASIQEALYKNVGNLDFAEIETAEDFEAACHVIERRARFLYKIYGKHGRNERFKRVIATILSDEENHLKLNKAVARGPFFEKAMQADRYIFGEYLPKKYGGDALRGIQVFVNPVYWADLFSGNIISTSSCTA